MVRRILLGGAMLALFVAPAFAETADEVIEKYIKAEGGIDKIRSVQTIRMSGKSVMSQGMEMPLTRYSKRPNKMRVEFTFQGMTGIQAYDGKDAWALMPFMGKTTPEVMPAEESKRSAEQADIDGPLVDYKAKGNTVELVGKEPVDGADAYKLKVTLKGGDVRYYYIDAETGLTVKLTGTTMMRGTETEFATTMSDYRSVDGRMIPFAIENSAASSQMKQKFVLDKVEVNADLADSLFAVPANAVHASNGDSLSSGASKAADATKAPDKAAPAPKPKKTSTAKKG
jgi:outer membrane lipoprotein-sorting protein